MEEFEVLDVMECLRLLDGALVGRVVFTDKTLPSVQPVNFVLDGDAVIIRTAVGSDLARAVRDAVVAFEVDDIDLEQWRGWSVNAIGRAEVVTDPYEIDHLAALPLPIGTGRGERQFVRIPMTLLSGQRLVRQLADVAYD
ncbi:pyridoxamine 5'-phosphate oxidase family protein [Actinopolymorpha sp. B9G3]|uniref:pyridoxamine 5'-phosphate oxidase family protein n=1 Tax=unclassified Actinopolymorpha TaxID=2627063 RepID=UPI0032D8C459